ncbi:DUF4259 domain-containing protein [Micromonospora sp. NBC_01796]|uniref:DUF4259 domain-containing protein n=1 Tax=Micromonospora sp. NBC_01796 TaxID=2975987 RepID=UPI002DDA39AF|nr:DUF4259 domain-containing protein [Micromonospora sp. NBC_01796]WSA88566.1 DUF4259 domain-containing protein [Micromonospora sp. NBC_01796]
MGTWDDGPSDNDSAAGWCGDLHDADPSARAALVRAALATAASNAGHLRQRESGLEGTDGRTRTKVNAGGCWWSQGDSNP